MKHRKVTKLNKRNTATSKKKKKDDDVMTANCDVIVFFCNLSPISSHNFIYLTKTENRTKKSLTQLSYYCLK